jgi:hypothetical protein
MLGSQQSKMDHLIDYKQSTEHVFVETARFLLPVIGLQVLTATRHPHNRNMSSWIPDWSQNLPLNSRFFDPEYLAVQKLAEYRYEVNSMPGASNECLELRAIGCRFGQVAHRSSVYSFDSLEDVAVQYNNLIQGYDECGRDPEERGEMGQEIVDGKSPNDVCLERH